MATSTETTNIQDVSYGNVIIFVPHGDRNPVTVYVKEPYKFGAVVGCRAKVNEDGSVSTRGETHAYFAKPDAEVEKVVR